MMPALSLQNLTQKSGLSALGTMCSLAQLCDTRIGDNVVIGANSVVTHDLPSNGVYAGNPAKRICSFDEYKEKHNLALETHRYFTERWWDEWKNATPEEWEMMRLELAETWGYVGEKKA